MSPRLPILVDRSTYFLLARNPGARISLASRGHWAHNEEKLGALSVHMLWPGRGRQCTFAVQAHLYPVYPVIPPVKTRKVYLGLDTLQLP
jgi:hypothetical protein